MKRVFKNTVWMVANIAFFGMGLLPEIHTQAAVVEEQGLRQLEFQELIKQCDVTQTAGGSEALARLMRPSASVQMPIKRQKMIQHFLANVQERECIIEVLSDIAAAESSAMQYAKEVNETFIKVAHFYRSWIMPESLKGSPACLRLLYYSKLLGNVSAMFSSQALKNMGWAYLRDCGADKLHRLDAVKREFVDSDQDNFFQDLVQARSPEEMDRIIQQNLGDLNRIEQIFNAPSERERGWTFYLAAAFGIENITNQLDFVNAKFMQSDQDINNASYMSALTLMMDPRATAKDSIDVFTALKAKSQGCSETEDRNLLRQFEYQYPQAYRYARMKYGAATVGGLCGDCFNLVM